MKLRILFLALAMPAAWGLDDGARAPEEVEGPGGELLGHMKLVWVEPEFITLKSTPTQTVRLPIHHGFWKAEFSGAEGSAHAPEILLSVRRVGERIYLTGTQSPSNVRMLSPRLASDILFANQDGKMLAADETREEQPARVMLSAMTPEDSVVRTETPKHSEPAKPARVMLSAMTPEDSVVRTETVRETRLSAETLSKGEPSGSGTVALLPRLIPEDSVVRTAAPKGEAAAKPAAATPAAVEVAHAKQAAPALPAAEVAPVRSAAPRLALPAVRAESVEVALAKPADARRVEAAAGPDAPLAATKLEDTAWVAVRAHGRDSAFAAPAPRKANSVLTASESPLRSASSETWSQPSAHSAAPALRLASVHTPAGRSDMQPRREASMLAAADAPLNLPAPEPPQPVLAAKLEDANELAAATASVARPDAPAAPEADAQTPEASGPEVASAEPGPKKGKWVQRLEATIKKDGRVILKGTWVRKGTPKPAQDDVPN